MLGLVVADSGPLISLEKIAGGFGFLRLVVDRVLIPEAVLREVGAAEPQPHDYLIRHRIADLVEVVDVVDITALAALPGSRPLHLGELEAMAVAQERNLPVLLEDGDARRMAKGLGLRFIGTGGLVLAAARRGLIPRNHALRLLDDLLTAHRINLRLRDALVAELP